MSDRIDKLLQIMLKYAPADSQLHSAAPADLRIAMAATLEHLGLVLESGVESGRYVRNGDDIEKGPNFDTVPPWSFGEGLDVLQRMVDNGLAKEGTE